jgi:hypothetical protein
VKIDPVFAALAVATLVALAVIYHRSKKPDLLPPPRDSVKRGTPGAVP